MSVRCYHTVVLICISPAVGCVGHLFKCFMASCVFSLEKRLSPFPIFELGYVFFVVEF